jgi:protease-4
LTGRIVIALLILSLFVGFAILAKPSLAGSGGASRSERQSILPGTAPQYPPDTVAVLEIFDAIGFSGNDDPLGLSKEDVLSWIDKLESVEDNPSVRAVLIRVNSPGGTIAATQELYGEIQRLKAKGKKVTVSMEDIAASGAFYISCAANRIIANPGTLVGSIGVIISSMDLTGLMQKVGLGYNVIKSGTNKDILSGYRKMTGEERALLESVVMDSYDQFFSAVTNGRPITADELRPIADGRVFTGRQALKLHLVDELGDFQHAVNVTAKLAGIQGKPNVENIHEPKLSLLRYLTSSVSGLGHQRLEVKTAADRMFARFSSPVLYLFAN